MRIFWSIIALLAVATVVLLWRGNGDEHPTTPPQSASSDQSENAVDVQAAVTAPAPGTLENGASVATSVESRELPAPPSGTSAPIDDPAKTAQVSDSTDDPAATALAEDLLSSAQQRIATEEQTVETSLPHAGHKPAATQTLPPPLIGSDSDADKPAGKPTPHSVKPQADGSVLLDDRFVVRGSGTAEDPYQITWDLLISASETYQPRLGQTELPQRVKMLDGKHIKITGYLAFPLAQVEASELLVMLNMWDGCCIGVPPSPYDAIEVKLKEPLASGGRRFFNYGTLTGVLQVDPYLVNDWLLGLYIVEDGRLDFDM